MEGDGMRSVEGLCEGIAGKLGLLDLDRALDIFEKFVC